MATRRPLLVLLAIVAASLWLLRAGCTGFTAAPPSASPSLRGGSRAAQFAGAQRVAAGSGVVRQAAKEGEVFWSELSGITGPTLAFCGFLLVTLPFFIQGLPDASMFKV
uniref:Photosystem I reaction center subunit IX n=1 Tax=Pyrodinium bahamense TaxID=73915 RepID=A0A6T9D8K6_9DINO